MPFRRRTKRRRRSRRRRKKNRYVRSSKRRRSNRHQVLRIPREIVPSMLYVTLPYTSRHVVPLQLSNGFTQTIAMRANSAFDPLWSLGGHQPLGFDQWAALYRTYTVVRSALTCSFDATSVARTTCIIATMDATRFTSWAAHNKDALIEDPKTVFVSASGSDENPTSHKRLRARYSASAFWKRKTLTDLEQEALVTEDPASSALYGVMFHSFTNNDSDIIALLRMTYTVCFRHPKFLALS